MTPGRTISRAGLFAAVLLGTFNTASTETLRAGGVGSAMATLPVLFSAFDRSEESKLEVIPSLGSSGALRAVAEGVLDIAVSGRLLNREELAQGRLRSLRSARRMSSLPHSSTRIASKVLKSSKSLVLRRRHGPMDRRSGLSCARKVIATPLYSATCSPAWPRLSRGLGNVRMSPQPRPIRTTRTWRSVFQAL